MRKKDLTITLIETIREANGWEGTDKLPELVQVIEALSRESVVKTFKFMMERNLNLLEVANAEERAVLCGEMFALRQFYTLERGKAVKYCEDFVRGKENARKR